ncbi:MAG TPA: hypothetical protein VGN34_03325 [Ktedonobacteraceae bacterium]
MNLKSRGNKAEYDDGTHQQQSREAARARYQGERKNLFALRRGVVVHHLHGTSSFSVASS